MAPFGARADHHVMTPPKEPTSGKDEPAESSRLEEARRIVEEYAADLREFIKNLRRRMH
jgi:hypothetical protein